MSLYFRNFRGNLEKPIDLNNLRFGENILGTATITNDTRNTGVPNQNQPSVRPRSNGILLSITMN